MKNKGVKRKFKVSADHLLKEANLTLRNFIKHGASFTEENAVRFPLHYASILEEAINHAMNLDIDSVVRCKLKQKTSDLKKAFKNCEMVMRRIRKIVRDTFSDSSKELHLFNFGDYHPIRTNVIKLSKYMETTLKKLSSHRDQLSTQGMIDKLLDDVTQIIDDISDQHIDQHTAKYNRPVQTVERNTAYNIVYDHLKDLSDTAEIIFHDQPLIRGLFYLPKPKKKQAN